MGLAQTNLVRERMMNLSHPGREDTAREKMKGQE